MSYVVLARRYRPQKFSELLGQDHVSVTLKNAVQTQRTAHAYLFTGPRGVGKTSAARILAKALRCENPSNGEPCNLCSSCLSIQQGNSIDVLEIDAASNTGVDNIRDLRDGVGYAASEGRYKIYIIDEVHMLSTAAFNALLKTLEEPPSHVVFIFATTELHKVLPTIQSRCQRFDFKKIPPHLMQPFLKELCKKENVSIDEPSLRTLVTESEGCLRDAESLLDQAIAFCGPQIDIATLTEALGLLNRQDFLTLMEHVGFHRSSEALKKVVHLFSQGIDPRILLGRLIEFYRELHYRYVTQEILLPDPDFDPVFAKLIEHLSLDEVVRGLDLVLRTQSSLLSSSDAFYVLESLVVKLSLQRPALRAEANVSEDREEVVPAASPQAFVSAAPAKVAPTSREVSAPPPSGYTPAPLSTNSLEPLNHFIRQKKPTWTSVLQSILSLEIVDGGVKVRAKGDFAGKRLASVDGIEVLKQAYNVQKAQILLEEPSMGSTAGALANSGVSREAKILEKRKQAREHEAVQLAVSLLDGKIVETKVLDDEIKKG